MGYRLSRHQSGAVLQVTLLLFLLVPHGDIGNAEGACVLRFDISPADSIFTLSGSVDPLGTINQAPGQTLKLKGALHVAFPNATCPPSSVSSLVLDGASFVAPPTAAGPNIILSPSDAVARVEIFGSSLATITLMDVSFGITSGPIGTPVSSFAVNQSWAFLTGLANVSLSSGLTPLFGTYPVATAGIFTTNTANNMATISIPGVRAEFPITAGGQKAIVKFNGNITASLRLGCPAACSLLGACSVDAGCSCDCGFSGLDCATEIRPPLVLNSSAVNPPNSTTLVVQGPGLGDRVAATPPLQVVVSNTSCSDVTRVDNETVTCNFLPAVGNGKGQAVVLSQGCQMTLRAKPAIISSFAMSVPASPTSPSSGRSKDLPPLPNFVGSGFDQTKCSMGVVPAACYAYPAGANITGPCACACASNWVGLDCSTCTSDAACKTKRCDTTPYYSAGTKEKRYACTATSKDLTTVIQPSISFFCDVESAFCRVILIVNNSAATPVFCSGEKCQFNQKDVVVSGSDASVSCSEVSCSCDTSNGKCPADIAAVISQVQGGVDMKCSGSGACQLTVGGLLAVVETKCSFGECTDAAGVTFKYSRTNWRVVGIALAVSLLLLIASIFLFMFLRKRYRQRREAEFVEWLSTKGNSGGPGATLTTSNLSVHTMASYSHCVEGLGKTVMGHYLYHKMNGCVVGSDSEAYRREIVSGVNISLQRGKMLALMGPSGSGKTTLLNVLAAVGGGRTAGTQASGQVAVDGLARDASFRQLAAYVPQEDFLHSSLTVRESIEYSAKLRLPAYMPAGMKAAKVRHIIESLGLAHVAENSVGSTALGPGLSGGERRRVRIGMELVVEPRVILLDEPTSGLDSSAAVRLVQTLRQIAEAGAIVVLSVHQPSPDVFRQFDQILLLSARGKPVYSGSREGIADYFAELGHPCPADRNFADHMMDVVSKADGIEEMTGPAEQHQQPGVHHQVADNPPRGEGSKGPSLRQTLRRPDFERSLVSELAVMFWCEMTNIVRRPTLLGLHLVVALLMGALVGWVFFNVPDDLTGFQNRAGAMFFSIALFSFSSLSALEAFIAERIVFTAEGSSRYFRVLSYFLSKLTLDWLFLRILPVVVYCCAMYWMVGLRHEAGKFALFMSWLSLTAMISGGICSCISLVMSNVGPANIVAIILVLLQLLFAGFLVKLQSIDSSIRWLQYLSYPHYALENLVSSDIEGKTLLFKPAGATTAIPVKAEIFLETFGLHEKYRTRNSWLLLAFAIIVALLTYTLLMLRVKQATNFYLSPPQSSLHTKKDLGSTGGIQPKHNISKIPFEANRKEKSTLE